MAAEHGGSAGRHQRQRHNEAGQQGIGDGKPHIRKDLPGDTLYKEDGDKDDDGGQRGGEDGAGYLFCALNGGLAGRNAHAAQPIDIFNDNDGVIHQHANAQGQATHGDDIERNAAKIHQNKRRNHADDDAGADDDGGFPVL